MNRANSQQKGTYPDSFTGVPEVLCTDIINSCSQGSLHPKEIEKIWYRPDPWDEREGWIGVLRTVSKACYSIAVAPVLSYRMIGRKLNVGETMQLLLAAGRFPVEPGYSMDEFATYVHLWIPIPAVEENEVVRVLDSSQEGISAFRKDLIKISDEMFDLDLRKKYSYPKPTLPEIKLLPSDMKAMETILSYCDQHAQGIFHLVMKRWDKLGFKVRTTPTTISLEAPYGNKSIQILYLMAGSYKKAPAIGLNWDGLRNFPAIPKEAISQYQQAVKHLSPLRETESAAYIDITDQFTLEKARELLKEVEKLVGSIGPVEGEKKPVSEPRTAQGIAATLELCEPSEQEIFKSLMKTWGEAGGVIHCQRPGRIYLRLKTRKHHNGHFSQESHLFNLLTLTSPKGKAPARIEFAWGLATATYASYLDCIPVEVEKYESAISKMEGFTQHGTIRYIPASDLKDAEVLEEVAEEILKIKEKEYWPTTLDEAAQLMVDRIGREEKEAIANADEAGLYLIHGLIGQGICNGFGLWEGNEPLLHSYGTADPDNASFVIMQAVQRLVKADST